MHRSVPAALLCLLSAATVFADVTVIEKQGVPKPGKHNRNHTTNATGSQSLIDSGGLRYFINTNITFSTTSSGSAAMSEASYTHSVPASTSAGGTTASTLNDAFDGYNELCLSLNNSVSQCETGNGNYVLYNKLGPATTECPGPVSRVNRQVVFPVQTSGNIQMQRKVFVPDNDEFGRWLNYFTNTGGSPQTVTMVTSNNLGSDSNTKIVKTSDGTGVASVATTNLWVNTFQNFTGKTTSDPREAHILQGPGAVTPLSGIFFEDGNDNPFWGYTFTLQPGQTRIIVNFVTGQPTNLAAQNKAAELTGSTLPPNALQCLTSAEKAEIGNFNAALPIGEVPALSTKGMIGLFLLLSVAAVAALRWRRSPVAGS
jgi:hypothetical protein